MKTIRSTTLLVAATMTWLATPLPAQNNRNDRAAEAALQAAMNRELVDGDLQAAIAQYTKLIETHAQSRAIAAKALYHLGQAHEKLGNAEARKAYERVAREFADQKEVAADAGRRLAVLSGGSIANGENLRRVPVAPGAYVNFSFDGRWMTSTRWGAPGRDNGYNELLVQDTATGETKRLLEGSCGTPCSFSSGAMISPDAKLVAYAWYDDGEIQGNGQLRVIANQPGAAPRVLVRKAEWNVDPIAWAPDSQSILVVLRQKQVRKQLGWVSVVDGSVKAIQSLENRWVNESGPQISLSPDGRHIVYAALANPPSATSSSTASADTHIYLLSADGSNEVALVKSASVNKSPVWTPDGAHVVFTSNLSGKTDLWSVAVRNGKAEGPLTLLKRDFGEIRALGMTKAGTFYFQQSKMGVEQIHIAEFTPGGGSRILESFVGFNPAWSPDGKTLAFKRHSARSQVRNNVVVRSAETGEETIFPRDTHWETPQWLDSTRFLTLADTDHEGGVPWWHSVDLTKNTFSRATPGRRGRAMIAAISPDEKTLYTAAGEPSKFNGFDRIIAVDLASGQEREVLRFSGIPELPGGGGVGIAISPDGRSLAVATTNPKTAEARLFRVDVDGGNYRELHGPYQANTTWEKLVWTKDGRSIVFAASVGGRNSNRKGEIMRIGSAGGSPESTGVTIDNLRTFDLSPDGSRIAYATTAQPLTSSRALYAIDNLPALLKGAQ